MGWCSATEIMDTALQAAEAAVGEVLDKGAGAAADVQRCMDVALSPFVRQLAGKLRNEDWDCIEESEYFERFPQEMLGYSDKEYLEYLAAALEDADGDRHKDLVRKIAALYERMENGE